MINFQFYRNPPNSDLGLGFGGVLRKLSQKHISFWQNLVIEGARPNLGLDFGGVWGDFWEIESLSCC